MFWAAILGALVVIVAIPNFGIDAESFRAGTAQRARAHAARRDAAPDCAARVPGVADPKRLIDFLVAAMPPAAAVLATITNVFNLWLAGRIVKFSGRLTRPWPAACRP